MTQTLEADTTLTAAQKRAEQRRINARNRKVSMRERKLRRIYKGRDDLDVPPARQIVDRYTALRDSGRLPIDTDELDGTIVAVRRHHYDSGASRYETMCVIGVGALFMLLYLWRAESRDGLDTLQTFDLAIMFVLGALCAAGLGVLVWGWAYDSKNKRAFAFRAHADALLSEAENADTSDIAAVTR
ncbi:hypothetical protein ABIC28_005145 [Rhodococcus sp. PvR044]|uniref:hypothetical protein n=1 Tax=Rhodococcus sp. PvR044 TaxID=3156402 RepID=UPI0033952C57